MGQAIGGPEELRHLMKQILWLVLDSSGSMVENGKHFIARGVARSVEQYCRLGYGSADLKLAVWRNEARLIDWNPNDELPLEMLDCNGSTSARPLLALLGEQPKIKVMLITDGYWARDDEKMLQRWMDRLPPGVLRVIKVGADANPRLKGVDVFLAEDMLTALDGWLNGGGQ